MSQIVKKKKGRPSKADLEARAAAAAAESANGHHRRRTAEEEEEEEERDIRRSLRRRSGVRYNLLDYDDDDYLDDDDEFEFDDGRPEAEGGGGGRREKKLKFVLKLNNSSDSGRAARSNGGEAARARRAGFRRSESEEEDEEEEEDRFVKKRKISVDADEDDEADDDFGNNYDEEERGGREEYNKPDFVDGVPSRTPMPEKKRLELILDKLQKKDTYGAYAEPVGPDELPDYHDIIKHPMDFATVRKKLANGSYSIFEQFESDVYLICSNAMEYNTPETIYHKQARTIKELAQRKFHRVRAYIKQTRVENEGTKKEANSEQQGKPYPIIKKQMKKPLGHSAQDPVSSDFLHGATPATTDAHNTSSDVQASNHERHSNSEGLADGISSLGEDNVEKVEDLQSGKGMTKLGRKSLVLDENRRATYEISNQPVDRSESIFATFEGEDKQLIPVGLYGEHSYAQSLAHYAATLGPVAWRTASKIIEQALPQGSKFGRGWVVEYEPIPTPVLYVADQSPKEFPSARKEQSPAVSAKMNKSCETPNSSIEHLGAGGPSLNGKPCFFPGFGGRRPTTPSGSLVQVENPFVRKLQNAANLTEHTSADDRGQKRPISDAKPPQMPTWGGHLSATSTGAAIQQQNQFNRRLQSACFPAKINEPVESIVTTSGCLESGSNSEGKSSILPTSRGSRSNTPTGPVIHPQNLFSRNNSTRPENPVSNRMDPNAPNLTNQKTNPFLQKQFVGNAEMPNSRGSRPSTPTGPFIDHQNPFSRNNSMRPENPVSNRMDPSAPSLTNQKMNPFVQKQFPGNAEMPNSRGSRPSTPTGPVIDHQDPFTRNNSMRPENSVSNRMDPNAPTPTNQKTNPFVQKQFPGNAEMSTSRGSRPSTPTGAVIDHQDPFTRNNSTRPENSVSNRMDANAPTLINHKTNPFVQKQFPGNAEMSTSRGSRPSTPTGAVIDHQDPFSRNNSTRPEISVSNRMDPNAPTLTNHKTNRFVQKQFPGNAEMSTSRGSRPNTPTGPVIDHQNPFSRNNSMRTENSAANRMDANAPSLTNQKTNHFVQKQFPGNAEMPNSWAEDTISKNKNFLQQPLPRRPPFPAGEGVISGRPPNGNVNHYLDINQMASSPSSGVKISFPPRPEQGLSDPLQAMRLSAENAQKQQIKMNNLFGPMPFRPSVQTLRGDNMTAGAAWMHASSGDINRHATGNLSVHSNQIPAKSSYNNTQELYPHILQSGEYPASGSRYFHPERSKATFEEHVSDHVKASNDAHVQNRSMVFPLQSPRQGLSPHTEQKRKQDTLPPDLNVAFQSTADPQQPDLALQL